MSPERTSSASTPSSSRIFWDEDVLVDTMGNRVLITDTESGGFTPSLCTLDSVHIAVPHGESLHILIKPSSQPGKSRFADAVRKNGLSDDHLEKHGVTIQNAREQILDFFDRQGGAVALVAFNAGHDRRFFDESLDLRLDHWYDAMRTSAARNGLHRISLDKAFEQETGMSSPRGAVHDAAEDTSMLLEIVSAQIQSGHSPTPLRRVRGQSAQEISGQDERPAIPVDLSFLHEGGHQAFSDTAHGFLDFIEDYPPDSVDDLVNSLYTLRCITNAVPDNAKSKVIQVPVNVEKSSQDLIEFYGEQGKKEDDLAVDLLSSMPPTSLKKMGIPSQDVAPDLYQIKNENMQISFEREYPLLSLLGDSEEDLRLMANLRSAKSRAKNIAETLMKRVKTMKLAGSISDDDQDRLGMNVTILREFRLKPSSAREMVDGDFGKSFSSINDFIKASVKAWPASRALKKTVATIEDPGF
jgi:hypothetical protein